MLTKHDYVPSNDGELLTFAKHLYAYALAAYARWGVLSPQAMLETAITGFETALAAFTNPNHRQLQTTKNSPCVSVWSG
jgi:hypothetical protein